MKEEVVKKVSKALLKKIDGESVEIQFPFTVEIDMNLSAEHQLFCIAMEEIIALKNYIDKNFLTKAEDK